jgi:ATP-dependent protease ClpP protease subunit
VDDMSADLIISQLLLLDAEDQTKGIKLFINSPGGSITAGAFSQISIERAYSYIRSIKI